MPATVGIHGWVLCAEGARPAVRNSDVSRRALMPGDDCGPGPAVTEVPDPAVTEAPVLVVSDASAPSTSDASDPVVSASSVAAVSEASATGRSTTKSVPSGADSSLRSRKQSECRGVPPALAKTAAEAGLSSAMNVTRRRR